jgi:hypothetical protein
MKSHLAVGIDVGAGKANSPVRIYVRWVVVRQHPQTQGRDDEALSGIQSLEREGGVVNDPRSGDVHAGSCVLTSNELR